MLTRTVYLDVNGDTIAYALEKADHTTASLGTAQSAHPTVTQRITGAPIDVAPKGTGKTYHRKTSGDGTQLADYTVITDLALLKDARKTEVDAKSDELIEAGFTYSSKQFSLETTAQLNWLGIVTASRASDFSYPYPVSVLDNSGYHEAADEAEMITIGNAASTRLKSIVADGVVLKKQIEDASYATTAEGTPSVEQVVDNRA